MSALLRNANRGDGSTQPYSHIVDDIIEINAISIVLVLFRSSIIYRKSECPIFYQILQAPF